MRGQLAFVLVAATSIGCLSSPETLGPITEVVAGADLSCALSTAGEVTCWGENHLGYKNTSPNGDEEGEPRLRGTLDFGGEVIVDLSLRSSHTCATSASGNAYC